VTTKLTTPEVATFLIGMDGWSVREVNDQPRLTKRYAFERFDDAMAFASRIASVAEEEDHHPRLTVEWGGVTVQWWTHSAGGITRADFTMARKTDRLLTEPLEPPLGRTS
jgi:4a-hydroxytetrahydrobiopterin dehydratase